MDLITHIPAFAPSRSPPPPLLVLLQATDLPRWRVQRLLISEDLPLKNLRFHPYRAPSHGK